MQERLAGIEKGLNSNNRHLKIFAGELGLLRTRVEQLETDMEDSAQGRS